MADVSKLRDENGTLYDIKDATARQLIEGTPTMNASFVGTALVLEDVHSLDNAEEVSF